MVKKRKIQELSEKKNRKNVENFNLQREKKMCSSAILHSISRLMQ